MITYHISKFTIQSTGADGGHYYVSTEIELNGINREMTVLFKNKTDELKLNQLEEFDVKGNLVDEGIKNTLMLLDSEIINK